MAQSSVKLAIGGCIIIGLVAILLVIEDEPIEEIDEVEDTLRFVQVLFRHGDRTPDEKDLYPKDPYYNYTYYPYGLGQLTNEGKLKEFNMGKELHSRYKSFLGPVYYPQLLTAISSDYSRTKMSLQLVLAGLFPPTSEYAWHDTLSWQPIPYEYTKYRDDYLFFAGLFCPNMYKEYLKVLKLGEVQEVIKNVSDVIDYMLETTGLDLHTDLSKVWPLYLNFETQVELGLEIPEFAKKFYPQPLKDMAIYQYFLVTYNKEMKRLVSGNLLKRMMHEASLIRNTPDSQHKIVLYSGHEMHLGGILRILDLYYPHVPPYGAYFALEMHEIDNQFGFKIYYQDYSEKKAKLLKHPGCDEFCTYDEFVNLVQDFYYDPEYCGA